MYITDITITNDIITQNFVRKYSWHIVLPGVLFSSVIGNVV